MAEQAAAGGMGGKSELGVPIAEAVMEQPKLEYRIVQAHQGGSPHGQGSATGSIETQFNDLVRLGWEPLGGLCTSVMSQDEDCVVSGKYTTHALTYSQSMIKRA